MNAKKALLYRACATGLAIGAAFLTLQQSVSAATLTHRYNFTDDGTGTNVVDLVGGAAWNGTIPNGGDFATITNQLILSSIDSQYAQFPAGMITNNSSITVDMWATVGGSVWGFLWTFGNTDPNTGLGGNCIFLQPAASRLAISRNQPSYNGEENAFFPSLQNTTNVHLTCIIDPPRRTLAVYWNGVLAGANNAETVSMTNVWDIYSYIGKSLYSDPYTDVTVDEYRIFSGALNGVEVAGYDVAGPDSVIPNTGPITNLIVSAPFLQLVQSGHETVSVAAQSTLFTNELGDPKLITVNNYLCTFSSANTNILRVDTNGVVTSIQPGTTSITASYASVSNSIAITVFPEPISLLHRWSFNDPDDGSGNIGASIADSVGGINWNGTLSNGGSLTNGQLSMLGASQQYVDIPTNIFSGMTNVTFDVWATFQSALPWNAWFFGFGDKNTSVGGSYFFVQPQSGSFVMAGVFPGYLGETRTSAAADWSGQTVHITCVASTGGGYLAIYTNGVLAQINNSLTYLIGSIHNNYGYINRSLYSGDPYVDLTIDEFRIYSGAMSADTVAMNQALGPDLLAPPTLSVAKVGPDAVLSWSTNFPGFQLVSKTGLTDSSWDPVSISPVISGENYQVAIPTTNTSTFFRLSK